MSLVNNSVCNYLFKREADGITKLKCENKPQFVDEILETLMKVNHYLLTNKEAFALLDPEPSDNQCHLYALMTYQIQKKYKGMSEEEKSARNEENRYLHLAFFLNYAFVADPDTLVRVVTKAIGEMGLPKKNLRKQEKFIQFLRDPDKLREKTVRYMLNGHFKETLGENLAKKELSSRFSLALREHFEDEASGPMERSRRNRDLFAELVQLSNENLLIEARPGRRGSGLYTFPKLAGIAYFVDQVKRQNIPIVVKVKVVTQDGSGGVVCKASREIGPDEPVILFEAFATDGSKTVPDCMKEAKDCPTYFHSTVRGKNYAVRKERHDAEGKCFYCKEVPIDLAPYIERIDKVMERKEEMLYALGADFVEKQQSGFEIYLKDRIRYPLLSSIYIQALAHVKEMGLDMNAPTTFSVCHVYNDVGRYANTPQLQLDMTREQFLVSRGIL